MNEKYTKESFTEYEQEKIDKMVGNGTSLEGAIKTRYAERKRKKVLKIERPKEEE